MFKYLKRKKKEYYGEPAIDQETVTDVELQQTNRYDHGRYVGRLLNPDDQFWPPADQLQPPPNTGDNSPPPQ